MYGPLFFQNTIIRSIVYNNITLVSPLEVMHKENDIHDQGDDGIPIVHNNKHNIIHGNILSTRRYFT